MVYFNEVIINIWPSIICNLSPMALDLFFGSLCSVHLLLAKTTGTNIKVNTEIKITHKLLNRIPNIL